MSGEPQGPDARDACAAGAQPAVWVDEGGVTFPAWTVAELVDGLVRTYWFSDEDAARRFAERRQTPPVSPPH